MEPCRKLTLLKPEESRSVGKPMVRWPELVEEDLMKMGVRNWIRKQQDENSGGQFWKRLRSTKDCNRRRRRRRRGGGGGGRNVLRAKSI